MKHIVVPALIITTVAIGSSALAKPGPRGFAGPRGPLVSLLAKADSDGDGKVTRAEARQAHTKHFNAMDANSDGVITQTERQQQWEKWRQEAQRERMAREDANKDGRLSRDEADMRPRRFERLDSNSDGFLTLAELQAAGPPGGKAARLGARAARHDADGDGRVTRQEAQDGFDTMFARRDVDKDGALSKEELRARGPGGCWRGSDGSGRAGQKPGKANRR